jgi:D-lyxose ketol-isomerase
MRGLANTKEQAAEMMRQAGMMLTVEEEQRIEVVDFGLGELERQGLRNITYVNNDRYCARDMMLLPRQTCPEHRHPPVESDPGKMETFRCRTGVVWLYVEGEASSPTHAQLPPGSEQYYTVMHEIELKPGNQYTIAENTLHWFQAGDMNAIVSEFSGTARDNKDIFTDPRVRRGEG